jgi:hypothetical protein
MYETVVACPFGRVRDLVQEWCKDATDEVSQFYDCYHSNFDEVENQWRDGFIPYTEGGFDGIVYASIQHAYGSGSVPSAIQPYLDRDLKECEEAWDEQNPDRTLGSLYSREHDGQGELLERSTEREHWLEKYYEFENEWLQEGGTYFYKIRALFYAANNSQNETGEAEVLFCVAINTDFEYGRDSVSYAKGGSEWVWERTVKVADITQPLIDALRVEAVNALAGC